jgi:hypothetical protein
VPGTYFVRVVGYGAAVNRYALHASVTPAGGTCVEDARENNDSLSQAGSSSDSYLIYPTDTVGGQICPNDDDWYLIYVFSDENLTTDLKYDHDLGDVDLAIYDSAGTLWRASTGVTGTESITFSPTASGYYYVKVYGYLGALGPYSLMTLVEYR